MKSKLLERLLKEKPEGKSDEISEALRRGYSGRQIIQAELPRAKSPVIKNGYIEYMGKLGYLKVPYTSETFAMLCQMLLKEVETR